jgi:membrane-associated phospholipid phosphatase
VHTRRSILAKLCVLLRPARADIAALNVWRVLIAGALVAAACLAAVPLDPIGYRAGLAADTGDYDWHRLFRIMGYAPTWLIVAAAFVMIDSARARKLGWSLATSRAGLLVTSMVIGAILAEGMKVLVRRERPHLHGGGYGFRPFSDGPLDATGLGMPSSHTAVAFAALGMLCYIYPRATLLWLALGVGCGLTRCINISHFVSDATVAAVLGLLAARAVWYLHLALHGLHPRRLTDRPFC